MKFKNFLMTFTFLCALTFVFFPQTESICDGFECFEGQQSFAVVEGKDFELAPGIYAVSEANGSFMTACIGILVTSVAFIRRKQMKPGFTLAK